MITARLCRRLIWLFGPFVLGGNAANAHYIGNPEVLVSGKADKDDKIVVSRAIEKILDVTAHPETLNDLLVPSLQLSSCFKLNNGAQRCDWDPLRGNGIALALVDFNMVSVNRPGDLGGTVFWDARNDVCIAPDAVSGFGVPRIERSSLQVNPLLAGKCWS